jgi:hypothetical protein
MALNSHRLNCCDFHGDCRQGRDCPHRVKHDLSEVLHDALAYLSAYVHWRWHHEGHRAAKRFARSERIIARKQRAERAGLRGTHT